MRLLHEVFPCSSTSTVSLAQQAREAEKVIEERKRCVRIVRSVSIKHAGDYFWMADEIIREIEEGK